MGCLLLFSNIYTLNSADTEKFLSKYSTRDLLSLHKRLVDSYLDEASFNTIDAILLPGLHLSTTLSGDDVPSFEDPTDASSSDFLEYLQVSPQVSKPSRISLQALECEIGNQDGVLIAENGGNGSDMCV